MQYCEIASQYFCLGVDYETPCGIRRQVGKISPYYTARERVWVQKILVTWLNDAVIYGERITVDAYI